MPPADLPSLEHRLALLEEGAAGLLTVFAGEGLADVGDFVAELLFQVGGRIRACLKTRDVVARLGGDEFAVLLEGIADRDKAMQIAERIITELQTPFRLGTKEIFTSASIGIALSSPHYRQPEELLRENAACVVPLRLRWIGAAEEYGRIG